MPKYARTGAMLLALLMLAMIMAGCAQSAPANRRIGIVLPVGDDEYTKEAVRLAENEIQRLSAQRSFTYTLMKATTANEQLNYVNAFIQETQDSLNTNADISKGKTAYGMIVLWPMEQETLRPTVDRAREMGIPIFLCGERIDDFAPTSYAVVDTDATAQLALDYIEKRTEGRILAMDEGPSNTMFVKSFLKIAGEKATVVDCNGAGGDMRAAGKASLESAISAGGGEEAVFAANDELALGALDAVKANPGCGIRVIASVGGTKALLDAMADAPVDMVTYAYTPTTMKMVMQIAADVATGISILPEYRIITTQVDKAYEKAYRQSDEYIARYGG